MLIIVSCIGVPAWNPNDPCFDSKRLCFEGLTCKNRGQLGSRYISCSFIFPPTTDSHFDVSSTVAPHSKCVRLHPHRKDWRIACTSGKTLRSYGSNWHTGLLGKIERNWSRRNDCNPKDSSRTILHCPPKLPMSLINVVILLEHATNIPWYFQYQPWTPQFCSVQIKKNWQCPFEKYVHQIGSCAQVGVKLKNISKHHLVYQCQSPCISIPPRGYNCTYRAYIYNLAIHKHTTSFLTVLEPALPQTPLIAAGHSSGASVVLVETWKKTTKVGDGQSDVFFPKDLAKGVS